MIYPDQERINAIERSAIDSTIHYFAAIRRKIAEQTGADLLEESPEGLAKFCSVASSEFNSGFLGMKLDALISAIENLQANISRASAGTIHVDGFVDRETALFNAEQDVADCFGAALECFYDGADTDAESKENSNKFEFASAHHQLFTAFFSAYWSRFQKELKNAGRCDD